jgi:hypothetical protein
MNMTGLRAAIASTAAVLCIVVVATLTSQVNAALPRYVQSIYHII